MDWVQSVLTDEPSDVTKLKQAWLNEQHAPELLAYQTSLVDSIKAQLDALSESIETLEEQKRVENVLRLKLMKLDFTR